MLFVSEEVPVDAWKKAFITLYNVGMKVEFNGFYKNSCAVIEVKNPLGEKYSKYFPMTEEEINNISTYLVTGVGKSLIDHDWTKLYRQRLFDETNEIGQIIELLKSWPDCPRAQIAVWNNKTDKRRDHIAPCLQLLWFKIIEGRMDLHVHMRTSDCYGKLLMNFNEFIALQNYMANQLNINIGVYRHFIDSLHFHNNNREDVDKLYSCLEFEVG